MFSLPGKEISQRDIVGRARQSGVETHRITVTLAAPAPGN
jgi:hypothetical protein